MIVSRAPVVALLPLDERPVTGRLAAMVGAVAGAQVLLPPGSLLPRVRVLGDRDGLTAWLTGPAAGADVLVVSLEMLAFGGLVPSRIGYEGTVESLRRWEVLRMFDVPVHAAGVVTRTPDADDPAEEPEYYGWHGRALHAASAALSTGHPLPAGTDPALARDFLGRRLRNHVLNLASLGLAADGVLDTLVIGADDTATAAIGTREQQWLAQWPAWLGIADRVMTYPGADEIGVVLVARVLSQQLDRPPRVRVNATHGLDRVAPYENVPVLQTVLGQLRAAGAMVASAGSDQADLDLVVHPPSGCRGDFAIAPPHATDPAAAEGTADLVADLLATGARVAVADAAYPGGADPALVSALARRLDGRWERLAGWAAWNTAGNTIGTAIGHGLAVVAGQCQGTFDSQAHAMLLRHRLLEDWGWMSSARQQVRALIGSDPTRHDRVPDDGTAEWLAAQLLARRLADLGPGWSVDHVSFPWRRTFEIDFTVGRS